MTTKPTREQQTKEAKSNGSTVSAPVKPGWEELEIGAVVHTGNGTEYKTGDWRSERPMVDKDKCINCLFCWVFCPDAAVNVVDEKFSSIDYYHCKGCGICATECPAKCISMEDEAKFQNEVTVVNSSGAVVVNSKSNGGSGKGGLK